MNQHDILGVGFHADAMRIEQMNERWHGGVQQRGQPRGEAVARDPWRDERLAVGFALTQAGKRRRRLPRLQQAVDAFPPDRAQHAVLLFLQKRRRAEIAVRNPYDFA